MSKETDDTYSGTKNYILAFPSGEHDDQVVAMTLGLSKLSRMLFPESRTCVVSNVDIRPRNGHYYRIGWVPGRLDEKGTFVVFDVTDNVVLRFERMSADEQISRLIQASAAYGGAPVWAFDGTDRAQLWALETQGVCVVPVKFTSADRTAAYEHLSLLIRNRVISYQHYPELIAELDAFTSDFTLSGVPDYSTQTAQQSGIHALCLVSNDLDTVPLVARERVLPLLPRTVGLLGVKAHAADMLSSLALINA